MQTNVKEPTQLADRTLDRIVAALKDAGKLGQHVQRDARRMPLVQLGRPPLCLGRDDELAAVEKRLLSERLVLVVGGPGEGKSTLAAEAVHRMLDGGRVFSGVYLVDLANVPGEALWTEDAH